MKKITGMIALMLASVLLLAGCANTGAVSSETVSKNGEVVIKVAGSTSVGPVIEALAEKYTAAHANVTINVEQTGSGAGVTACGDGTADMGMASRDLKEDEIALYPDMQSQILCLDGIAVVVSKDNPVTALKVEDVRKIFLGEITDWSQVGGQAGPITLYSRDSVSGTREAFQNLFLGKDEAGEQIEIDDTMCLIVDSNGAMGTQVEGDPSGIGYMSLGLTGEHGVTALTIDGVEATVENLLDGSYTYFRNFNLLTMGDPEGELKSFIEYCTGDPEAAEYLEGKGYVMP